MAFPEISEGEGPVLETARAIAEDEFFDVLEVSSVKDPSVRRELASLMETSGMIPVFCAGGNIIRRNADLNALQSSDRKEAMAFVKQLLDEATSLEAKTFVLCSGPDPGKARREAAMSALASSLIEISDYAGKEMMISLESFDREVDKRRLVGPTSEAVDLILRVRRDSTNVGLTMDLSHLPLLGERASISLKKAKKVLDHTHIGNCLPRADAHPRFGAPNGCNGAREVKEFIQTLASIGYLKKYPAIVSFEVKPAPAESPEAVIAGSKRVLKAAMRGLK
jgi:sugar phosphate isomerase/epimerase